MDNCLFCKIISGNIPATKIYEDDEVFVFLDIKPINPGHALVIPKNHSANLYEIEDDDLYHVIAVVKKMSKTIKKALSADGINLEMNNDAPAGQMIFHSHIHIIPRFADDGIKHWPGKKYEGGHQEEVAEKIKAAL